MDIQVLASSSRGNCYRVSDGSTPLLLECGIPYKEIQRGLNYQVTMAGGCLISHEHKDHCKALSEVSNKAGVDCYMSQGTAEALGVAGHRIKLIRAMEQFTLGTWTVLPFDTQHDAAEPLGFLLASRTGEKLLFATDTYYIRYRFNGLTHIMVEANYADDILAANYASGSVPAQMQKRIMRSHFSLANVLKFLKANDLSRVEEIWLIHLSSDNAHEAEFEAAIQRATGKPVYIAQALARKPVYVAAR